MRSPLLLVLPLLVACSGPATRLEPEVTTATGMMGETIQVDFTLLDETDRALGNEEVTFALEGAPAEVTLRSTTATTDSRGGVTAIVTLGAEGTFDVVATAGDATPGVVTVTVGTRQSPYIPCTDDRDCAPSESCLLVTTTNTAGRICTRECADESMCPVLGDFGGACLTAGSRPLCIQRCNSGLDCMVMNSCSGLMSREGTTEMVCLPVN